MSQMYPKLVKISTLLVPGNMIVNGQPIKQEVTGIICPNCNKIIQAFQSKLPESIVYKFCNDKYEILSTEFKYCSKCGIELEYFSIIDVDQISEKESTN